MMKIDWSRQADQDRDAIYDHIEVNNPRVAARMDSLFDKAAATLLEHPTRGMPGAIPGTRELLTARSYCLVYEIDGETVRVLTLVQAARRRSQLD